MGISEADRNLIDRSYNFGFGADNNGNVLGITDNRDNSRSQSFAYDNLNRLISAQNAGTDCSKTLPDGKTEYWGNSYGYDPWGNLINKTITKCGAENLQASALASNQLAGYGYDAAGNMISDPTDGFTATYDAGNMLKTVGPITYWYDNDGQRYIKWNNGVPVKSYFYGSDGEILAEGSGGSTLTAEYIFFNGKRIARVDLPGNAVHYYLSDALNTTSMEVNSSGVIENESDYYPWGGELKFTANDPANPYKFTGKERDTETGLDYFGARHYSNALARFISADYSSTPIPVPYADFNDPQSLNLYSYVRNIPTVRVDPDGHCCWDEIKSQVSSFVTGVAKEIHNMAEDQAASMPSGVGESTGLTGMGSDFGATPIIETPNNVAEGLGMAATVVAPLALGAVGEEGEATVTVNAERGAASESAILKSLGRPKNTESVTASEGKSIPDFKDKKVIGEIKDSKVVSNTKQLRIQKEAAQQSGRKHQLHTGTKTHVTKPAGQGTTVIRHDELGPK